MNSEHANKNPFRESDFPDEKEDIVSDNNEPNDNLKENDKEFLTKK